MKKKILAVLLCLAMVMSVLAGCGSSTYKEEKTKVLDSITRLGATVLFSYTQTNYIEKIIPENSREKPLSLALPSAVSNGCYLKTV